MQVYAESLEKLISNMGHAKPTIMTAVPRFIKIFYKNNMNFENKRIKENNDQTLNGKKFKRRIKFSEKIINSLCEKLVRKKIRNQFGGNLQAFVSGGGALIKILNF